MLYSTALPIPPQPIDCTGPLLRIVVEHARPHSEPALRPVPASVFSDHVQCSARREPVVRLRFPWVDKLPAPFLRRLVGLCTRQSKDTTDYLALCFPSDSSSEEIRRPDPDKQRGVCARTARSATIRLAERCFF